MIKRFFDIIVSFIGLIICLPFLILLWPAFWLSMPGPLLFTQYRVGINRKEFRLYKLRSMTARSNSSEGSFDPGDKSRITRLGKFFRRTKIDEIPQLYNVLKGDMSIVGPRPEVRKWTEVYSEKWEVVLKVKPGITDNASIMFYNEEELLSHSPDPVETYLNNVLPTKLDLNINYVNNQTFKEDIKIIFRTLQRILLR